MTVSGGKMLLDRVTFPIPEKCLVGVIGPEWRGQVDAAQRADRDAPRRTPAPCCTTTGICISDYAELRYRIGLVPQENILHTQLTARRALQYSAELRFPADTRASRAGRPGQRGDGRARPDQARGHARRPAVRRAAQAGQHGPGTADQAVAAVPGRADLRPGSGPGQVGHGADAGPGPRRPDGHRGHAQRGQPGHLRPAARPRPRREGSPSTARLPRACATSPCPAGRSCFRRSTVSPTATGRPSSPRRPTTRSTWRGSARAGRARRTEQALALRREARSAARSGSWPP